ncbi:ATM interactor [Holothuria leucospilota]|uniref:ATM interactor n=1 Tax=Holothuria leucospilota TaxID=206669 RepID=A0A9Q1HD58_HOLLE|nr:ATM interactor [Holothuria leucospilota]
MAELTVICPSEEDLQRAIMRNIECSVSSCKRHFSTLPALWMHCAKTHKIYEEKWQEEAFKNNKKSSQTISKQFVCPVSGCSRGKDSGKPFCRLSLLKTHYTNQHAEKKFSCQKCGSRFGSAKYLEVHVNRCGQLFKCSCGAPYTTPEALYMHAKRQKHELTQEFMQTRKYMWRRKDLEAELHGEPPPSTGKKRKPENIPILPKGPTFILHQIVRPLQVTACTQTEKEDVVPHASNFNLADKTQAPASRKRRRAAESKRNECVTGSTDIIPLARVVDHVDQRFATRQLQTLAMSRDLGLINLQYQANQVIPGVTPPGSNQQISSENVGANIFPTMGSASLPSGEVRWDVQASSSSCLVAPHSSQYSASSGTTTDVFQSRGVQSSSMPVAMSGAHGHSNLQASVASNSNTVGLSSIGSHSVSTFQSVSAPSVTNAPGQVHSTFSGSSMDGIPESRDCNDSINFRSIGTNLEPLGVPTQTDFTFLDLFASCDIQTQTMESIFACSPVMTETSGTQTQVQERTTSAVETNPTLTNAAQTLVDNVLETSPNQASMHTQTLIAEQTTMETQTPGTPHALNMRTVELQTMTHSSIATSPCAQPSPSLQHETQETQTMDLISSHDLLSLDIYTQTGLTADDLGDNSSNDDLEFSTIHTQTVDDFDLGVFGIDGNCASVQTDFPEERNERSNVGTQVQSQFLERDTVSADVQTDTSGNVSQCGNSEFPS